MNRQRNPIAGQLMTEVSGISYEPIERVGVVYMPKACCTDMNGALALFRRIDPSVGMIITISGEQLDTVYFKMHDGKWGAVLDNAYSPAHAKGAAMAAMRRLAQLRVWRSPSLAEARAAHTGRDRRGAAV